LYGLRHVVVPVPVQHQIAEKARLHLAACISLNHQLGRPSRAIADYTA
jgi:hypothetical protein